MDRKDFLSQVGVGAAAFLAPICLGGIAGCGKSSKDSTPIAPGSVDFTLNVSSGALASNGGFLVSQGILVARTNSGTFLAVSAACTHEGTSVTYNAVENNFVCPNHGAKFSNSGAVISGPSFTNLKSYNTSLTNTTLRIYS